MRSEDLTKSLVLSLVNLYRLGETKGSGENGIFNGRKLIPLGFDTRCRLQPAPEMKPQKLANSPRDVLSIQLFSQVYYLSSILEKEPMLCENVYG